MAVINQRERTAPGAVDAPNAFVETGGRRLGVAFLAALQAKFVPIRHSPTDLWREGMILGLGSTTFTLLHVLLSLVGLVAGLVAVGGLLSGRRLDGWTATFLTATVLTNITGFAFPFVRFLPSHGVGIVSLLVLPVVLLALYGKRLEGRWRTIYAVGAVAVLYLNAFVLVAQLFLRVPALRALAPTQQEPPFLVTQLFVLAMFVVLGRAALKGFGAEAASGLTTTVARQPAAVA